MKVVSGEIQSFPSLLTVAGGPVTHVSQVHFDKVEFGRVKLHMGDRRSRLYLCAQRREHGGVVPASGHQLRRRGVQVHGQRFPSGRQ